MTISPWQENIDGNFTQAFVDACFPSNESSHHQQYPQSIENTEKDKNRIISFELRQTLVEIVLAWTRDYAEGVILKSENEDQSLFQALGFISQHKRVKNDTKAKEPVIFVSYAASTSMNQVQKLLQDEKVVIVECPDYIALQLARYFQSNFTNNGLVDFDTNLRLKEGFLGLTNQSNKKQDDDYMHEFEAYEHDFLDVDQNYIDDNECNCQETGTHHFDLIEEPEDKLLVKNAQFLDQLNNDQKQQPIITASQSTFSILLLFLCIISCLAGVFVYLSDQNTNNISFAMYQPFVKDMRTKFLEKFRHVFRQSQLN